MERKIRSQMETRMNHSGGFVGIAVPKIRENFWGRLKNFQ